MRTSARIPAILLLSWLAAAPLAALAEDGYCIVVSTATQADAAWGPVVKSLAGKHRAKVLAYGQSVDESLGELRREFPRYVAFVARPEEATRQFVAQANRLTRRLDDDPYTDALWAIVTGFDAHDAMRIVQCQEPLVIRRVAAGTEIELPACEEGVWYCELNQGKMVRKQAGGKAEQLPGPADTTKALVDALNVDHAQLFVTSGHATERDWQIGYRYRNGQFRSQAGKLYGVDTQGRRWPVESANPKVYLAVGNCLMGHIDGVDAMALAFLHSAGVNQLVGYTVPTWYGYAGWGMLDYFVEQPGRFTLVEAFFANQQALIHRLATCFPGLESADRAAGGELPAAARSAGLSWQDAKGLIYDRDTLACYGDPAWQARMAPGPLAWEQTLVEQGGVYRLEIRPRRGDGSFRPINTNGSQRGGRPFFQLFPQRVDPRTVRILEGAELAPQVSDNFLLAPLPTLCDPARSYRVVFSASRSKPEAPAKGSK